MTVFGWLNGRCPFGIESIAPKGSVAILFLGSTGFGPTSDSINCFQVVVKRPAAGHIVGTIGPSLSATRCLVLFFFSNIFFIRTRHAFTHLLTVIILASHQPPFCLGPSLLVSLLAQDWDRPPAMTSVSFLLVKCSSLHRQLSSFLSNSGFTSAQLFCFFVSFPSTQTKRKRLSERRAIYA